MVDVDLDMMDELVEEACRCPYWLAVIVTLACFAGMISAMFLLVLGSVEAFKEEGLDVYLRQAAFVSNYTLSWLYEGFGIEADKIIVDYVLEMPVAALAKDFMMYILGLCMNMFLIFLVTFYLIFENSTEYVCLVKRTLLLLLLVLLLLLLMIFEHFCFLNYD